MNDLRPGLPSNETRSQALAQSSTLMLPTVGGSTGPSSSWVPKTSSIQALGFLTGSGTVAPPVDGAILGLEVGAAVLGGTAVQAGQRLRATDGVEAADLAEAR